MKSKEAIIDDIFDKYSSAEIEAVILRLKKVGLSQIETVKIIRDRLRMSLKDADNYVVNSVAWKDCLEDNIRIRSDFFDFLEHDN